MLDNTPSAEQKESDPNTVGKIFLKLGIPENVVTEAIDDFSVSLSNDVSNMASKLSQSIAYKVTYAISFLIYFIILLLLLSLVFRVVNLFAKVPGINFVNKTLGLLFGLLLGYFVVTTASYILPKLGLFITEDIIDKTHVLKLITNFNPLSLIAGV